MNNENILKTITLSIIYYYSLIKRFSVTEGLINFIYDSITKMWNEYTSDINEDSIDMLCILDDMECDILNVNNSNLYDDITHVIISYFDRGNEINPNMNIIGLYNNYLPGMDITHNQISKIMEFYLCN